MKSLIILFGLPGAGKTYVGEILRDLYWYHLHDGDSDLPKEMKERIDQALPLTDDMRDEFFRRLLKHVQELTDMHQRLVITQTFIKEKYRKWALDAFPDANFVLIEANESVREQRLRERKDYPLDIDYAKEMTRFFEKPEIEHKIVNNTHDGRQHIIEQLKQIQVY